jgi:hypothetical protein
MLILHFSSSEILYGCRSALLTSECAIYTKLICCNLWFPPFINWFQISIVLKILEHVFFFLVIAVVIWRSSRAATFLARLNYFDLSHCAWCLVSRMKMSHGCFSLNFPILLLFYQLTLLLASPDLISRTGIYGLNSTMLRWKMMCPKFVMQAISPELQ